MSGVKEGYQPVVEFQEAMRQRNDLVAQSPGGRYQLLMGRQYKNLFLYDSQEQMIMLLSRKDRSTAEQKVTFIDNHTFCVDSGNHVDFYNARTGEHVDFLELQFGYRTEEKMLLGFTYSQESQLFGALYVNEEPHNVLFHRYWAALFSREGKLLDQFRTDIDLVRRWGNIVIPRLTMEEGVLAVSSRHLNADYRLHFYTHETQVMEKNLI